jgi:phosphate transport system permease protein
MVALTTPADVARETAKRIERRAGADTPGRVFRYVLFGALVLAMVILSALLIDIVRKGWDVYTERFGFFLTHGFSQTGAAQSGVWQGIVGSIQLAIVTGLVAFPLGICAAVYLAEYARDNPLTRFININIRNLAGVPSIVYGLLGLFLFVDKFEGITGGRSVIAGGLTLACLVLPIVIITSVEALRAVPDSIREAAYGVGATKWEMIRHHVLPVAAPGILTGTMLSTARALGEAAPIILVGATTGLLTYGDHGFLERLQGAFTALPVNIFQFARQPGADWRANAAAASLVILAVVLLINGFAIYLRNRFEKKF